MNARGESRRSTQRIALALLTAALCAALAEASAAQGGWRQWEVRLHDGQRLDANPLGAPNNGQLSLSVAGYAGRERRIARSLVHVVAAMPSAESLPVIPIVASCDDAIVRRDGTRTVGHITLLRVRWSEGVVVQRGDTVSLRDVAYLVFAARSPASAACGREAPPEDPDLTNRCVLYPIGIGQRPRLCADDSRT